MQKPTNKKVKFLEPIGQPKGEDSYRSQAYTNELFNTLNISSNRCPLEISPNIDPVKPCLPNQHVEGQLRTKNMGEPPSLPQMSSKRRPSSIERFSRVFCRDAKASRGPNSNAKHCPAHLDANATFEAPGRGGYDDISPAQRITDKLKEMVIEEDFRKQNPVMRRQLFKYRGICGTLGNPVFNNTPVAPPQYEIRPPARRLPGYPQPKKQHPMYRTTSYDIGSCEPYLESTPIFYYPDDQSFTTERAIGGVYEDAHLTTELDKDPMW